MKVIYQENFSIPLINESDREFQPRLDYDEAALEVLSKDIAKNGQHNPVGLYQKSDYFQVIYGFQRVIALKRLERNTVRANIYEDATWEELHEQSISNNERHVDLNDLEKAFYIKQLRDKGISVDRLGELFGVKKSAIYNYLMVAGLDDTTQECLHRQLISLNHAVELVRYDNFSKRLEKLRSVISFGLSVRELKAGRWTRMFPLHGRISICPQHMRVVSVYGRPEDVGINPNSLGPFAKKQWQDEENEVACSTCPHFRGVHNEGDSSTVDCAYDYDSMPAALRSLFSREETLVKGGLILTKLRS